MSLIDDALSFHADALESAAGEPVTYRFGDLVIAIAMAVRGRSEFEQISSEGEVRTESRTIDWLIRREAMVDPSTGNAVEPSVGATITDSHGTVYDVVPGINPTGWRHSDDHGFTYRVHSMLRAQES